MRILRKRHCRGDEKNLAAPALDPNVPVLLQLRRWRTVSQAVLDKVTQYRDALVGVVTFPSIHPQDMWRQHTVYVASLNTWFHRYSIQPYYHGHHSARMRTFACDNTLIDQWTCKDCLLMTAHPEGLFVSDVDLNSARVVRADGSCVRRLPLNLYLPDATDVIIVGSNLYAACLEGIFVVPLHGSQPPRMVVTPSPYSVPYRILSLNKAGVFLCSDERNTRVLVFEAETSQLLSQWERIKSRRPYHYAPDSTFVAYLCNQEVCVTVDFQHRTATIIRLQDSVPVGKFPLDCEVRWNRNLRRVYLCDGRLFMKRC